jgi:glycosyltransferase involved in cell wall biosynthesis
LVVDVIPNAVDLPGDPPRRAGHGRDVSLLFVGNLMYRPNIDAAHLLVETILPEIRRRLGDALRLQLVGLHAGGLETLADRNVEVTGFVRDLRHVYARADVVVVPLSVGGGTRIKLLEAFANQVPVVASPVGASGLRVAAGRHLLLAEDPGGFAAAVERLVRTPSLARRLVREAARLVRDEYSTDVVIPRVRHFFRQAADRARVGPNCRRGLDRPQRLA